MTARKRSPWSALQPRAVMEIRSNVGLEPHAFEGWFATVGGRNGARRIGPNWDGPSMAVQLSKKPRAAVDGRAPED
jgi:hypothetical protein